MSIARRRPRQGVNIGDVYETLQTFMGGNLVNYFNRFGRQWQAYVEAEGTSRTNIDNIGRFYVQNYLRQFHSALCSHQRQAHYRARIHHALQRI